MTESKHVFVAYDETDMFAVVEFCHELIRAGLRPWLDIWELESTFDRAAAQQHALRHAAEVVLFIGERGWMTAQEAKYARDLVYWFEGHDRPAYVVSQRDCMLELPPQGRYAALQPDQLAQAMATARVGNQDPGDTTPYVGLRSMEDQDARWFFGRERELAELLAHLRQPAKQLITIVGPSGWGKSSMVKAGLIPRLRCGALGRCDWVIARVRPGLTPCQQLADEIVKLQIACGIPDPDDENLGEIVRSYSLHDLMMTDDDALHAALAPIIVDHRVLILVDQLEELITEARSDRRGADADEVERFLAILQHAAAADPRVWIVATLRDQFLPHFLGDARLGQAIRDNIHAVSATTALAQLYDIIDLPARRLGVALEPALVFHLCEEVQAESDALALLQFGLRRTWALRGRSVTNLSLADYQAMGPDPLPSMVGATLSRCMNRLLAEDESYAEVFRWLFRQLRTPAESSVDAARRLSVTDCGHDEDAIYIINELAGTTPPLLTIFYERFRINYELTHELILWRWTQAREWRQIDQAATQMRHELRTAALPYAKTRDKRFLWPQSRAEAACAFFSRELIVLDYVEHDFLARSVAGTWRDVARPLVEVLGLPALAFTVAAGFAIHALNRDLGTVVAGEREARAEAQRNATERSLAQRETEVARVLEARQQSHRASELSSHRNDTTPVLLALAGFEPHLEQLDAPPRGAYEALLDVLSIDGMVGVATVHKHRTPMRLLSFSPDAEQLVAVTEGFTAEVYEVDDGEQSVSLTGHEDYIVALAFSPTGEQIATGSLDSTVRLWATDGKPGPVLAGHSGFVVSVAFSPDGTQVVSGGMDSTVRVWDASSGRELQRWSTDEGGARVTVSPAGDYVASAGANGATRVWSLRDRREVAKLDGHTGTVDGLVFSPDGRLLATASRDATTRLWARPSFAPAGVLHGHEGPVTALAFASDAAHVATGGRDHAVIVWDTESAEIVAKLDGHTDTITDLAFVANEDVLLSTSADNTGRMWAASSGRELAVLAGHEAAIADLVVSPAGDRIALGGLDGRLSVWRRTTHPAAATLRGHTGTIWSLAYSPSGGSLATGGSDGTIRIWDTESNEVVSVLEGHTDAVIEVEYAADASRLATGDLGGVVNLWNPDTANDPTTLRTTIGALYALEFSPANDQLVVIGMADTIQIFDPQSGDPIRTLEGHRGAIFSVAFTPDGELLATAGEDGTVRIWRSASGELEHELPSTTGPVSMLAFSPDGEYLATTGADTDVRLRAKSLGWAVLHTLPHKEPVSAILFSPTNGRLATGTIDGVRQWSLHDGELDRYINQNEIDVTTLAYSADGQYLALGGRDGRVQLRLAWDYTMLAERSHGGPIWDIAFSPNGRYVAAAGEDQMARIWPMPREAMRRICDQLAPLEDYTKFAFICHSNPL